MAKDKNKPPIPKPGAPKKKEEQQFAPRPVPKKEEDGISLQPMGGTLQQGQFQGKFDQFMNLRQNRALKGFCKPEGFQGMQGMGGMQTPGKGMQGMQGMQGMGGMQGIARTAAMATPHGRAAVIGSSIAQQAMQNSQGMQSPGQGMQGGMGGMQGPAMKIAAVTPQGRAAMVASSFLQQNKGQGMQFSVNIGKNDLKSTLSIFSEKGVLGQIGKLSYEQGGKKASLEGGEIVNKAIELGAKAVESAVNAVKSTLDVGKGNQNSPFRQGIDVPKKPTLKPDE